MNAGLNDTEFTQGLYEITIYNKDSVATTYNLSSIGAATANAFVPGDDSVQEQTKYTSNYGTVQFLDSNRGNKYVSHSLVTVPAGQGVVVMVKFTPPQGASPKLFPIYSGYITVTPVWTAVPYPTITVPYAGMVG